MPLRPVENSAVPARVARRRVVIQGLLITALAAAASATLGGSMLGRFLSSVTLDVLIRRAETYQNESIVLIDITDDDFERIFSKQRPLDPRKIVQLVNAAVKGGAGIVAIDIATEDWPQSKEIDAALANIDGTPQDGRPAAIVWARDFHRKPNVVGQQYYMEPILGGTPLAAHECYGLPALAEEAGVVRWFFTGLALDDGLRPSFVEQILYRREHGSCLEHGTDAELRVIEFAAQIRSESARTLLEENAQPDWGVAARPYAGKVVILGGSFHAGGDVRETPVGSRSGLEINGQAVASALRGEARREIGEGWAMACDVTLGVLVVLTGLLGQRAHVCATAIAFFVAIGGMWLLWREYYLFLSFVPIGCGLLLHLYLSRFLPHERHAAA